MKRNLNRLECGFSGNLERPRLMSASHQHPEVEINFLLEGEIIYLVRGNHVRIPPGRMVVFWASTPHQSVKVTSSKFFWFTVPLAWIYQWKLPPAFMKKLLDGRMLVDIPTGDDGTNCARWVKDLAAQEEGFREAAQLEIRARLMRFALRSAGSPARQMHTTTPAGGLRRVEKMARFIADHYLDEIAAAQIAGAASLNVNYASTLFRKHCGMSPSDYLLLHRAHHAHRLLATTDRKIISIAFESGFHSLSRFYAAFEKIFRCPPREVRRRGYWNG